MNPRLAPPTSERPLALDAPRPWYQRPLLDSASQAYVNELMYGEEAQVVFRDRGEGDYVDYVNRGLLNASRLASFALPQGPVQVSRVGADDNTRQAPRPPVAASAGEDAIRQERERRLNEATLRYAGLIAMRRASHGDALLERQQQRGRAGRVLARILGVILNPAEIGDYRRARRLARHSADAASEYRQQVEAYITAEPRTQIQEVNARRALMDQFETAVQGQALAQVASRQRPDGTRYRSWWDNRRARLAELWLGGNRAERVAIVAPPAILVGATIGVLVGAASWPIVLVGLGGALLSGRSIGGAVASTVNRFQAAHNPTQAAHTQQAQGRNAAHARLLRPVLMPNEQQRDVTHVYESATLALARQNLHRKRQAERVGAVAAGAAFGVAWGVTHAQAMSGRGSHPASTHGAKPGSRPSATPNTTPSAPTVNVHDAPWNVAHQLQPGHEWDLINSSMQQYNAAHGTHLHLVNNANGTPWTWIEDGARALNPAQQTTFNQFMQSVAVHGP